MHIYIYIYIYILEFTQYKGWTDTTIELQVREAPTDESIQEISF